MRRLLILAALCALTAATALPSLRASAAQTEPWCPACSMAPASIPYEPNATGLSDQGKAIVETVAATLQADPTVRVQLVAYASGAPEGAATARRLALIRAVGVRAYLIERGVSSRRIDVRALGNRNDGGLLDRVDIVTLDK